MSMHEFDTALQRRPHKDWDGTCLHARLSSCVKAHPVRVVTFAVSYMAPLPYNGKDLWSLQKGSSLDPTMLGAEHPSSKYPLHKTGIRLALGMS